MSVTRPWLDGADQPPPEPTPEYTQADVESAKEYLLARFRHFASATMDRYSPIPNDEMCDEMELAVPEIGGSERRKRKLYLAPRGTYKTTIVVRLIAWLVLKNPGIRISIGRAKHDEAKAILYEVKQVLKSEPVVRIFGDYERGDVDRGIPRAGIWNEDQINLGDRKEPTVGTFGLDVSTTGTHVDIAFVDDIINDKNYLSEVILDQAKRVLQALVPVLDPQWGSLLVTGTRWSTRDVYGLIIKDIEEDEKAGVRPQWTLYLRRARNKDGSLFFPSVLSARALADLKRELRRSPRLYAAWYDNEPYDDETKLFKPEYLANTWFTADFQSEPFPCLEVYVLDEEGRDTGQRELIPVEVTMTLDPAPTVTRRSDFNGVTVVACQNTQPFPTWWVLTARAYKLPPSAVGDEIVHLIAMFRPRVLLIESAQADVKMTERVAHGIRELGVRTTIQSYAALRDEKHGERGKGQRIGSLEAKFKFGEIRLHRDAVDALLDEYDKWEPTGNSHDDVLDALAMQFKVAIPSSVSTIEEAEKLYLQSEAEDEDSKEIGGEARDGRATIARTGRSAQALKIA